MKSEKNQARQHQASRFDQVLESSESQLKTPSELQLPTLSILMQDVPNIDAYRPKDIVVKDSEAQNWSTRSMANPTNQESQTDGWRPPLDLIASSQTYPLDSLGSWKDQGSSWSIQARSKHTGQQVSVFVGKKPFCDDRFNRFRDQIQTICHHAGPVLPAIMDYGTSETGLPYLIQSHPNGPSLRECHHGLHFAGIQFDARSSQMNALLKGFHNLATTLDWLHGNSIHSVALSPDNVYVSRSSDSLCVANLGLVDSNWPTSLVDDERRKTKDIMDFGKLLFAMVCVSDWNDGRWEQTFSLNASEALLKARESNHSIPKEFADFVAACRHNVRSCRFSTADQLATELHKLRNILFGHPDRMDHQQA